MPDTAEANPTCPRESAGDHSYANMERCMPTCMNCRREVEASMTRVGGRRLRKMRAMPSCTVDKCVEFLNTVEDSKTRFHLASMAWWRFSSEEVKADTSAIREIMTACRETRVPTLCLDYCHRALKLLSPLSEEQMAVWFGCEDRFHAARLFSGGIEERDGRKCRKCALFKMGCTMHGMLGADDCPLQGDRFVQDVAAAVKKAGGLWKNPCKGIKEGK